MRHPPQCSELLRCGWTGRADSEGQAGQAGRGSCLKCASISSAASIFNHCQNIRVHAHPGSTVWGITGWPHKVASHGGITIHNTGWYQPGPTLGCIGSESLLPLPAAPDATMPRFFLATSFLLKFSADFCEGAIVPRRAPV